MFEQQRTRFLVVGLVIALLAAAVPLAAMASEAASFGGDDAYDLAAGGNPELAFASSAGFVDAFAVSYSGDDDYDVAAGGTPELAFAKSNGFEFLAEAGDEFSDYLVARPDPSPSKLTGDEFYEYLDADWEPSKSLALVSIAAEGSDLLACDASGYSDFVASVSGGFSGDDDYDPAAGGRPEQSVFACAGAYGKLLACASADGLMQ